MKTNPNKCKGGQCEGYDHIKSECPNFLKKQKKGSAITLSDSDEEIERETTNKVMSFTSNCETCSDFSNVDLTNKELVIKWEEACILVEK
jgi:hypothetical protein